MFSLSKFCIDFQWWFEVDPEMYQVAQTAMATVTLKNEANGVTLPYTPKVFFGGNGVSGPTFVDNAAYREYVFDEFQARCLDIGVFFSVAADNAFAVTRAFIEAMYPDEEETTPKDEEINSGAFQLTVWSTIMGPLSLLFVSLYN
jgi:hypothetical protein